MEIFLNTLAFVNYTNFFPILLSFVAVKRYMVLNADNKKLCLLKCTSFLY